MFDVIWRLYLKGPRFSIIGNWSWINETWVGSILPVLGGDPKQAQPVIPEFLSLSHAWW